MIFVLSASPLFGGESPHNKLIGDWETKPYLSQLGTVVTGFTFTESGSCTVKIEFIDAKIPTVSKNGIYKVKGNILEIQEGDEIFSHTFNFEKNLLIIKESNGDSYQLLRK